MSFTNSATNLIAGSARQPEPVVGMGATVLWYTDRHAATVVEVVSASQIRVQADKATRVDTNGVSESQVYEFEADPTAAVVTYTKRRNGAWVAKGQPMKGGQRIALGYRSEYYDFSF